MIDRLVAEDGIVQFSDFDCADTELNFSKNYPVREISFNIVSE